MKGKFFAVRYYRAIALFLPFFILKLHAQTTLAAGDIAFTGYLGFGASASTDEFSFVLLKAVTSGTVINFTDNGWLRTNATTGSFRTGETTVTLTTSSALAVGTEIKIVGTTATLVSGGSAGTVSGTALSLSANGDQIIAYQGTSGSPTFITAIHMNVYDTNIGDPVTTTAAVWDGNTNNANASGIPTGLTTGTNAIWIGTQGDSNSEKDNAKFNCSGTLTTVAGIKNTIFNQANWTTSDGDPAGFSLPSSCNFLGTLPMELIDFTAEKQGKNILLKWATASEINNAYFDIEQSSDGKKFSVIAQIKGAGTTFTLQNYTFLIEKPLNDIHYYRLKQVDTDGTFSYSKTISVNIEKGENIAIFPTNTEGVVIIRAASDVIQSIQVVNTVGQIVGFQKNENYPIDFTRINVAYLPKGFYFIRVKTKGEFFMQKIFKN